MNRFARVLVFLLCCSVAAAAVAGTTGRLTGTVQDDQGQPLPGASVTVSSPTEIGGDKVAFADAAGGFSFPALTPGDFNVKVELLGFVAQERSEVQVRLDRTTELNVRMPPATFAEELTILAETPMVDPAQVSTAQTFKQEFLEKATVTNDRRDYRNVLDMAPGTDGRGSPRVFGSSVLENAFLIDGLNTTDPTDGGWGSDLPFDAIQEISFQTGGFESEYGNAIGGVVNVVTKSGGNQFSGSFDARYYSSSFYQNGEHFDRDTDKVEFLDPAATFGGPIVHDRLWFFSAYEATLSQTTPSLSPTTTKQRSATYLAKLTWQTTPHWRLTAKGYADPWEYDNIDASQFVAPEATSASTLGGGIYAADASGALRSNLLWNLGIGINRIDFDWTPQSGDFATPGHYNLVTDQTYGNALEAYYSQRDRDEYKTDLAWFVNDFAGTHEFKVGLVRNDLTYWQHDTVPSGFYYRDVTSDDWYGSGDPSPIPYRMWEVPGQGGITSTGKQDTIFLQDAWAVRPT